ncbi:GntR family transcriptional regulator [Streptomyces olivaceoviridis]|uniref:GntR family transcriptional regulator n=1 Tax=Streptomyces olivaceoviridis TaxID=1921 RepID=UPI0036A8D52A
MGDPVPLTRAATANGSASRGPVRTSVRESVFQALMALLMDHALKPGAKLSIDGLARELGVSQTPVREALARCESEGLVVHRPDVGYLAAPLLDQAGLNDLYDIRLLLEPTAAERATRLPSRGRALAVNSAESVQEEFVDRAAKTLAPGGRRLNPPGNEPGAAPANSLMERHGC